VEEAKCIFVAKLVLSLTNLITKISMLKRINV
jgi:hypothetical protein